MLPLGTPNLWVLAIFLANSEWKKPDSPSLKLEVSSATWNTGDLVYWRAFRNLQVQKCRESWVKEKINHMLFWKCVGLNGLCFLQLVWFKDNIGGFNHLPMVRGFITWDDTTLLWTWDLKFERSTTRCRAYVLGSRHRFWNVKDLEIKFDIVHCFVVSDLYSCDHEFLIETWT